MREPIFGDTLTEVLHRVVLQSPNGKPAKSVASALGKNHVVLLNELNPGQDRNKFAADQVLPLMLATGSTEPLLWLARQMSMACIALPVPGTGSGQSGRDALRAVQEFGDVIAAYNEALKGDNEIKPHELRDIRKEAHEAIEAILAFVEGLDRSQED